MTSDEAAGRQCILDQAQLLFFAHGYHGVSIRDIVQACGLSNATLYYHFESKQNLYVEVVKRYIDMVAQVVEEAGAGSGSCREQLTKMVEAFAKFIWESRSELQTLLRDLQEIDDEEMRQLVPEVAGKIPVLFAKVLEEGIAAGEIREVDTQRVGILLLDVINSLAARRMTGFVDGPPAEDVDLVINIVFEGIEA